MKSNYDVGVMFAAAVGLLIGLLVGWGTNQLALGIAIAVGIVLTMAYFFPSIAK